MTPAELWTALVATEQDVFAVRRQGRQLAAALGLESQDQVQVTRQMRAALGPVRVRFTVEDPGRASRSGRALLRIHAHAARVADDDFVAAVRVTKGLMDQWDVARDATGTSVSLARQLPGRSGAPTPEALAAIRADLAATGAGTPLEELAEHNRQLLAALDDVRRQRDELLRLNAELEETNQGVVALYAELSEELEATNRGVVALYAELDQRTNQARQASESKTRFLANVSHELRSPVTSVVGLTRLLRDPSSDPLTADQAEQLDLIDTSAAGLLTLVNELLDLAKAESGRLEAQREEVDLRGLFGTLRGTLRAAPMSGDTELVIDDPDLPVVHTDPIMLAQVLRNLLTNAMKFTPAGRVSLTAVRESGGDLALTVADTGIGIPADEQERVFEEFHQVRNPLQANYKGTGLGLPYAQRLVHILGGSISLSSVPGEGSTFTVRLPTDLAGEAGPRLTRVLMIDDDDGFRTAAARILRAGGFAVTEATDGGSALASADANPPDLILLDLRLAGQHGAMVLEALAANDRLAAVPIIVLSAFPGDLAGHPAEARATAVLDKTRTTLDDLCDVVRSTVEPR
jgi:signal transduction histidine kinase